MIVTKTQAAKVVARIARDVIEKRGDLPNREVMRWAAADPHWRSAVARLKWGELEAAINDGREAVCQRRHHEA